MSQLSPRDRLIYNEGERLIPGVTHDYMEVRRHAGSYLYFRAAIDLDIRRGAIESPVRIVDLGCGVGHGCATLSDLDGVQITGIDSSAESLEYAREHYQRTNIDWKQADLIEFIADMPAYDYVVSRAVIEHILDGIRLVHRSRWRCRLMFDVPYDEPPGGNPHHMISEIREKAFDLFDNAELFFQDLAGRVYARSQKPARPNVIMCCCRASGLSPLTQHLPLPFCPYWWQVGGPACPALVESAAEDLAAVDVITAGLQEREQTVMEQEIHNRQLQEALERQRQALAREKENFERDRIVRLVRGIQGLLGAGRAGSTAGGDDSVKKGRA